LEQIVAEALQLNEKERAQLARQLLVSLEPVAEDPAEIEQAWIQEALRRAAQMESGEVEGIPLEEVFRRIRASRGRSPKEA
jgi:putative addiction module component (TIGR02574 family)